MSQVSHTDVLVIGAGPAGLMTAVCLSRLNIPYRIIDRRLPEESAGQGDGIQPRTIEMWDSVGMGEKLRQTGFHLHRMVTYEANDDRSGIKATKQGPNISTSSARHPFEVLLEPKDIERLMRESLSERDVQVEQPVVPQQFRIINDSRPTGEYVVEVTCVHLKAEHVRTSHLPLTSRNELADLPECVETVESIRAKYVVGCDGAHSWVRHQCGITMEDLGGEALANDWNAAMGEVWGAMDLKPITDFPTLLAKNIIQSPLAGLLGTVPRPDSRMRIYARFQNDPIGNDGKTSAVQLADILMATFVRGFQPYTIAAEDITWCSLYRVRQGIASTFSHAQRIFIAGDACHVHSPNAGQGLNVSMADAYNLAWKLAYTLRGRAGGPLLETYETERRPCSITLIELDKEIQRLMRSSNMTEQYMSLIERQNAFTSGIGVQYDSRLTVPDFQDLACGLVLGQRLPHAEILRYDSWSRCSLLDTISYQMAFKLLIFPGDITLPAVGASFREFIERCASSKEVGNGDVQLGAILSVSHGTVLAEAGVVSEPVLRASQYVPRTLNTSD
ncbi:uncharacterized protein B0H18DRAFT_1051529 [Fomitopsis serialis]|uniref:uncharacterized protein n=1 Tax=Fomitopsis serialis TaxID=139415 RepID=UPI002007BDC7|nr:uncharacterized protein B0H18DRAFT_1051529 [Neoantrodia serialis]KAH9912822.1 hypothetical protein B0H18DRAFT_1051529 [Neoantrodia serialis]